MPPVVASDVVLMLIILFGSVLLFVTEKLPMEGVAFLVLVSLLLGGLVPEDQILSGFSNSAVITVTAMLIISAGLQRTGIIRFLANRLHEIVGRGQMGLSVVLSTTCGALSAFISNTATVAVLLPVSLSLSKERGISPSKILMPMSFAAQFGGVCTLIGTTTNLLLNSFVKDAGLPPLGMFEFAQLGIVYFAVGTVYMLVASRLLLPDREPVSDVAVEYDLHDYLTEMRVLEGSPLIGQTGEENDLMEMGADLRILEIIRDGKPIWAPKTTTIRENDILMIRGEVDRVLEVTERFHLEDWAEGNLSGAHLYSDDVGLVEVILPHGSKLVGRTLNQMDFYWRYHAAVLGIRRQGEVVQSRIAQTPFREGDTLLLQGHLSDLQKLAKERDFTLLQDLSTLKLKKRRAAFAVGVLVGILGVTSLGLTSILTASLIGVTVMVGARCLKMREAYEAIDMKIFLLLACLIPMGAAMQSTGTARLIAEFFMGFGSSSPLFALGMVYLLTMVLTAFMSNAATAVLLAPLALTIAGDMGLDPRPFLMAIAFAASTCFSTPVGYQTNTMVYGPGGYKYADFLKVGIPLNLLFFALSVWLIPVFWPFMPAAIAP